MSDHAIESIVSGLIMIAFFVFMIFLMRRLT
jgi:hypothetical protein